MNFNKNLNLKKIFILLISILSNELCMANYTESEYNQFSEQEIASEVDKKLETMRTEFAMQIVPGIIMNANLMSVVVEDPVMAKIDNDISNKSFVNHYRKLLAETLLPDYDINVLKAINKEVTNYLADTTDEKSIMNLNILSQEVNKKIDSFKEVKEFLNVLPKDIAQNTTEQKEQQISKLDIKFLNALLPKITEQMHTTTDETKKHYFTALHREINKRISDFDMDTDNSCRNIF